MLLFCDNSLQFTVVNNFDKKLHFQICYVVLNLSFFRFTSIINLFFLLAVLNINGTSTLHTQMTVWQAYHNNVCHVVWMFWLTLGTSLHFFLVLLLTLNIICLLQMLLYDISLWKTKRGYIYGRSCKILVSSSAND